MGLFSPGELPFLLKTDFPRTGQGFLLWLPSGEWLASRLASRLLAGLSLVVTLDIYYRLVWNLIKIYSYLKTKSWQGSICPTPVS